MDDNDVHRDLVFDMGTHGEDRVSEFVTVLHDTCHAGSCGHDGTHVCFFSSSVELCFYTHTQVQLTKFNAYTNELMNSKNAI